MRKDQQHKEVLDRIEELSKEMAQLRGERDAARDELSLSDQVKKLREEIATLEINKGKLQEAHARQLREVEHKVGLDEKRQEFERTRAVRDAELAVREEALADKQQRFEDEMTFQRERFETEVGYLHKMVDEVLERLPKVTWDHTSSSGEAPKPRAKRSAA